MRKESSRYFTRYEDNMLTTSYEKLGFFMDAMLGYMVTCYIYTNTEADPGRLTDIRSALVYNNMFASLLLDQFILHCTPDTITRSRSTWTRSGGIGH